MRVTLRVSHKGALEQYDQLGAAWQSPGNWKQVRAFS